MAANLAAHLVGYLHRLAQRDALRKRGTHIDGALIELGQELRAQQPKQGQSAHQQQHGSAHRQAAVGAAPGKHPPAAALDGAHHRVVVLAHVAVQQHGGQHGYQRQREQQGTQQGKPQREGQRREHLALHLLSLATPRTSPTFDRRLKASIPMRRARRSRAT